MDLVLGPYNLQGLSISKVKHSWISLTYCYNILLTVTFIHPATICSHMPGTLLAAREAVGNQTDTVPALTVNNQTGK